MATEINFDDFFSDKYFRKKKKHIFHIRRVLFILVCTLYRVFTFISLILLDPNIRYINKRFYHSKHRNTQANRMYIRAVNLKCHNMLS